MTLPNLSPRLRLAALLGALPLVLFGQAPQPSARPDENARIARDLAAFDFHVTAGTAPGYVDEATCELCHAALSRSYQEKGMARAFRRPRPETDIEDFAAPPFLHVPSRQHMEIRRRGGRLVFRRWQTDAAGQPINTFEREVDWILGSGDHARTYLYRTEGGELYQFPLAWYSQTRSWGMAPGFDRPDHEGVIRRVRRECVFCHASYPDLPAGADAYSAPQVFPAALPEGIGCQRCHGPAAEHVWLTLGGIGTREEIRAAVFNPGRLPASRRDEVCAACHLQPSVAISGLRRFGRGDFSFRAGEPLSDHFVQVDVEEEGRPASKRFEINHHPYRLQQSRCRTASGEPLSCLTCHDPHRRVPEAERAEHYRAACLTCHQQLPATEAHAAGTGDCVSCHMPKRRTQDVVRVVMTDHWIRRQPGGPELLAPLTEAEPVLTGIRLIGSRAPQGALGEVYRAAAVVRAAATADAVAYLEKTLAAARPAEVDPWLDLAQGQIRRGRFADVERTLQSVLARSPDHPQALEWLALSRAGQRKPDEAIDILKKVLALPSAAQRPEAEYNLGRLLTTQGRPAEAVPHLEKALAARPNLVAAWYHLGRLRIASGQTEEALTCWRRTLEIDPTHTDSYVALGRVLLARGEREEALRYLRHGARAAAKPEVLAEALREAEGSGPE
ncbi:MAG TPA: tetratricopeptide repeat protein [Thermoanaerobaculia bacterium]|nr:tetratricopeptide repeat protein [Thermoanaerobaculia bacterium]